MSTTTAREAGREMDAEVAETVLGWKRGRRYGNGNGEWIEPGREDAPHKRTWDTTPHFSTDFAAAWEVVQAVQARHPGWRFMLLGGDTAMGYVGDGSGGFVRDAEGGLIVAEESRFPFGWSAEFFGDMDPRVCTGRRHGEGHADTAPLAICRAAFLAQASRAAAAGPTEREA